MAITTANGEIDADDEIELFVDCLKMNLRRLVLPDTPNAISVGRRVKDLDATGILSTLSPT